MLTVSYNPELVNTGLITDNVLEDRFPRRPATISELTELFQASFADKSYGDVKKAMDTLYEFTVDYVSLVPTNDYKARKAALEQLPSFGEILFYVSAGKTVKETIKDLVRQIWSDFQPTAPAALN